MAWVGGMIFMIMVLIPTTRDPALQDQARTVMQISSQRFKRVAWAALITLMVTGTTNMMFHNVASAFATEKFWRSPIGTLFGWKLVLVALVVTLSIIHDFWIGPKTGTALRKDPNSPEAYRLRYATAWIGRANFLLSVIIVAIGVILFRVTPWPW